MRRPMARPFRYIACWLSTVVHTPSTNFTPYYTAAVFVAYKHAIPQAVVNKLKPRWRSIIATFLLDGSFYSWYIQNPSHDLWACRLERSTRKIERAEDHLLLSPPVPTKQASGKYEKPDGACWCQILIFLCRSCWAKSASHRKTDTQPRRRGDKKSPLRGMSHWRLPVGYQPSTAQIKTANRKKGLTCDLGCLPIWHTRKHRRSLFLWNQAGAIICSYDFNQAQHLGSQGTILTRPSMTHKWTLSTTHRQEIYIFTSPIKPLA